MLPSRLPLGVTALAAALVLLLAACSKQESSSNPSSTTASPTTTSQGGTGVAGADDPPASAPPGSGPSGTTVPADPRATEVAGLFDPTGVFPPDEMECLAASLIASVGYEDARTIAQSSNQGGLSNLSGPQRTGIVSAGNDCVSGRSTADLLLQLQAGLAESTNFPQLNDVTGCLTTALEGKTGEVLVASLELTNDPDIPTAIVEPLNACITGDTLGAAIIAMIKSGASPAPEQRQLDCMANRLKGAITFSEWVTASVDPTRRTPVITEAESTCGISLGG